MIADSNTFRYDERVPPQHQAVLTLLQSRLSASDVSRLSWLDLACGRGQIILNLPKGARAKIEYWAYDLNQEFARETRRTVDDLGFHSFVVTVGNLSNFDSILPSEMLFDFITLTNTIYEIEPVQLASLLASCLKTSDGYRDTVHLRHGKDQPSGTGRYTVVPRRYSLYSAPNARRSWGIKLPSRGRALES